MCVAMHRSSLRKHLQDLLRHVFVAGIRRMRVPGVAAVQDRFGAVHVDIVVGAVQRRTYHGVEVHRLEARLENGEVVEEVGSVELFAGKQGVVVADGDDGDVRVQSIDALDDGPVVHEVTGLGLDAGLGDDRNVRCDFHDRVQRVLRLLQGLAHAAELLRLLEEGQFRGLGNLAILGELDGCRQNGEPDVVETDADGDEVCLFDRLLVEAAQLLVVLHRVFAGVLAAGRGESVQGVGDIGLMAVSVVVVREEHAKFLRAHAGLGQRVQLLRVDLFRHPVRIGAGHPDEVVLLRFFRLMGRFVRRGRHTGGHAVAEADIGLVGLIVFAFGRAGTLRERGHTGDGHQHQHHEQDGYGLSNRSFHRGSLLTDWFSLRLVNRFPIIMPVIS